MVENDNQEKKGPVAKPALSVSIHVPPGIFNSVFFFIEQVGMVKRAITISGLEGSLPID